VFQGAFGTFQGAFGGVCVMLLGDVRADFGARESFFREVELGIAMFFLGGRTLTVFGCLRGEFGRRFNVCEAGFGGIGRNLAGTARLLWGAARCYTVAALRRNGCAANASAERCGTFFWQALPRPLSEIRLFSSACGGVLRLGEKCIKIIK